MHDLSSLNHSLSVSHCHCHTLHPPPPRSRSRSRSHRKQVVVSLLNKAIALARAGTPLRGFKSATATGLKGHVYIEASSEPDAKAAVKGLRIIYGYKIHVVPHADMTRVMTVKSRARAPVTKGAWVRLKRDKYKGDLAKVVHVTADGARAIVQHVPRLEVGS